VRKAERELVEVEAEIKLGERDLGRLARSAYQDGAPSELSLYLDAASIDDVLDRLAYSESAARSETALLRRLADARADLAAQRATLEAKREHVANLRRRPPRPWPGRRRWRPLRSRPSARCVRLVAEAKAAAAAIAAEKAAELRRMSVAKAESDRIGRVLAERAARAKAAAAAAAARARAAGRRAPTPRAGRSSGVGVLLRPVDGYVTSPYGMRVHPVTGVYKLHDGTDFGAPCGTPIYAAADGQVVEAGYSGAWGNRVVVDHGLIGGDGVGTGYNHMTDIAVRSGSVSRGQLVGWVGSTGYSTGCHLHLNVYVNGSTVDPMNYL
jgi:murein DD-endopeptidase MepM/ murein hydrolase activator NlpD